MTPSALSAPRLALTLAAILGGALPALSATVATPPSYAPSTHWNECWVANPGPSPVNVGVVELVSLIGTVVETSGIDVTVSAGRVYVLQHMGSGVTTAA